MTGQGRPTARSTPVRPGGGPAGEGRFVAAGVMLCAAWLAIMARPAVGGDRAVRLRLVWGGGEARRWEGRITINSGGFSQLRLLGLEPDEPGSIWIDGSVVHVRQKSSRTYDGVDVLATGPPEAALAIDFKPVAGNGQPFHEKIPVAEVSHGFISRSLDKAGNRLLVRRTPGDRLRVELDRDNLIFAPGESWKFRLLPQLNELAPGTELHLKARLTPARNTQSLWSAGADYTIGTADAKHPDSGMLVEVPLPEREGAYELTITASRVRFGRLVPAKPLAERDVQLLVLAPKSNRATEAAKTKWNVELEIDPTRSSRWDQLLKWPQLKRIPGLPKGPLGNRKADIWQSPLGPVMRLQPVRAARSANWQAFPLPIHTVGIPHLVEVSYPSNIPQDLAISVVEPNAAGLVTPIGLDSGVYVSPDTDRQPRMDKHRLVFWPRTKTPLLLLANRCQSTPALFGTIRVLVADGPLKRAIHATGEADGRLIAGYMDRPLLPENFSATDRLDPGIEQGIDDWQTFYEGASRLVDYLNHVGYNALMISVLADGSTIYPSQRLQPTPRYDTGPLATTGMDPVRKDGLELLLRICDRQSMRLIPALQFAAPLPELEALRRRNPRQATGLEWVGQDGATWFDRHPSQRGLGPYYNLLNPDVQRAMLAVVRELVERYGRHRAFEGLALQLTAAGYAQLPGPEWGLDDATVGRFQRDTGMKIPGAGTDRFAERARVLLGPKRPVWLRWRAGQVAAFYDRLQREVAAVQPEAKLFLATAGMFDRADIQDRLRPALSRRPKVLATMLEFGIQPDLLRGNDKIVLLRPELIGSPRPLAVRAVDMVINNAVQLDHQLASASQPGCLLFHRPERYTLPSFDQQSPFGKAHTFTSMLAQPLPSNAENRRRFAHSLATLDARALFDGGYLLPLGQEDALRSWIRVYRQLPAAGCQTSTVYQQPVTIRTLTNDHNTWIYLVNDSPWNIDVTLPLSTPADCRVTNVGSSAPLVDLADGPTGRVWQCSMKPYALVAAHCSAAGVTVHDPQVTVADGIKKQLDERIQDLSARAASLRRQPPDKVLKNPGFELPVEDTLIPGWEVVGASGETGVAIDAPGNHDMGHGLRLHGSDARLSVRSQWFAIPKTGRLALRVWVRAEHDSPQPVLRMAVEGPTDGPDYYRFGTAGGAQPGTRKLPDHWKEYIVPFDDLPTGRTERIRVRFDLIGTGTVWIDDVGLDRLYFDDIEQRVLYKIIVSAGQRLKNDQLSDCLHLLEGYWPRFLVENVPVVQRPVARQPHAPATRNANRDRPTTPPSMARRLKNLVPGFLKF